MEDNEYFNKGLSNFIKDFAYKNEIIAKFNNGKSISQIKKELTAPISEKGIIEILWTYLIEKSIILLYDIDDERNNQYDIIKKEGSFGKVYYEKISKAKIDKKEYISVNIKEQKESTKKFIREMFEKLPWKKETYFIQKEFLEKRNI